MFFFNCLARNCRTWVLRDPLNSQTDMRTCVTNTDTNEMICTFTCEPNFFFFHDNEFTDTFTHKCDFDTGDWDSRNVLDCIGKYRLYPRPIDFIRSFSVMWTIINNYFMIQMDWPSSSNEAYIESLLKSTNTKRNYKYMYNS